MADHVPYEISMMRATHEMMITGKLPLGLFFNAFIECFAIHARLLSNFLNNRDDVKVKDFTTAGYTPFASGKIPTRLHDKLNQQIAHLTEKRFDDPQDKLNLGDVIELRKRIDAEIAEFLQHMTPHYRDLWDTAEGHLRAWNDNGERVA